MLFHSHEFVFLFLPLVVALYYGLGRGVASKITLFLASLFFYGWWDVSFVPLLLGSMLFNYGMGRLLLRAPSRLLLAAGITANLGLLGYFKYFNFFREAFAQVAGTPYQPLAIALPLAISFYTFQQSAFLVDAYKKKIVNSEFLNYAMFVTFFPHLIAGPLLNHKVMMAQFSKVHEGPVDYDKIARGLFVFAIGLFKILVIASPLSLVADAGFAKAAPLSLPEGWVAAATFMLQLYFDFSAYSDMAIGAALMLGFIIPDNFRSPYRVRNMARFWQCWNITLGKFFRDYFYIPVCGKDAPDWRRDIMLFITFLLIGLWHGAGWTFVLFGALNGIAVVAARWWGKTGVKLPYALSWFVTILFLLALAEIFRAGNVAQAFSILRSMAGLGGGDLFAYALPRRDLLPGLSFTDALWMLPVAIAVCAWPKNSMQLREEFTPTAPYLLATLGLVLCAILKMSTAKAFIYFQF